MQKKIAKKKDEHGKGVALRVTYRHKGLPISLSLGKHKGLPISLSLRISVIPSRARVV